MRRSGFWASHCSSVLPSRTRCLFLISLLVDLLCIQLCISSAPAVRQLICFIAFSLSHIHTCMAGCTYTLNLGQFGLGPFSTTWLRLWIASLVLWFGFLVVWPENQRLWCFNAYACFRVRPVDSVLSGLMWRWLTNTYPPLSHQHSSISAPELLNQCGVVTLLFWLRAQTLTHSRRHSAPLRCRLAVTLMPALVRESAQQMLCSAHGPTLRRAREMFTLL